MQEQISGRGQGLSANTLKCIAIIAMIIDHIADGFLPQGGWPYVIMRFIGRITGPVMFFMVAEGYRHTRNVNRYTLRLLIFAAISYMPYLYFHGGELPNAGNWLQMSVIYTLLMGLLAIRLQHEVPNLLIRIPLLVVLFLLASFGDWGIQGFAMMLAFDYFHGDRNKQAFGYLLVAVMSGGMLWFAQYPVTALAFGFELNRDSYPGAFLNLGMALPILLLLRYNGRKGPGGALAKWGFYLIYPLHFVILGLIKFVLLPA